MNYLISIIASMISFYGTLAVVMVLLRGKIPSGVRGSLAIVVPILTFYCVWKILGHFRPETFKQLEAKGRVTSTAYRARRAFRVVELEIKGLHYYLELEDGGVLYLFGEKGMSLYGAPQNRQSTDLPPFPNTDFLVKRKAQDGSLMGVYVRGVPLEAEVVNVGNEKNYHDNPIMKEGEVRRDISYDAVKQWVLEGK
jgi:hypothetical protein